MTHSPSFHSAVPTFLVSDVGATLRWYEASLGFTTAGTFPDHEPYGYGSLQRGRAEIMLLVVPGYARPDLAALRPVGFWDAYIRTDGVGELWESMAGQSFITMPLKLQPYGNWEFAVRDLNGYHLVFGGDR